MRLRRHRSFIKDFKRANLADAQFEKFIYFLGCLRDGRKLPPESKDHALLGQYRDCHELHLGGDMLLIYMKSQQELILLRIGTHAQLFK